MPRCVVVIPTLNEAAHLAQVLEGFLTDPAATEIWVLDGGSSDGTQRIAQGYVQVSTRVRLIHNPGRTQAHACNRAARLAQTQGFDILLRADGHAHYPKGFVSGCLSVLADTEADSVTVPLIAHAPDDAPPWQAANAALQRTWLGTGGAAHRNLGAGGWVTHGHHAAMRLPVFCALGGYDTAFAANEDAELDLRLTAAGHRIWMCAALPVRYTPRATQNALFAQMRRNGRGRAQTAAKHRQPLALRQRLPLIATLGSLLPLLALPLHPAAALPALGYVALVAALAYGSPRITALALLANAGFSLGLLEGAPRRPQQVARA